MTRMAMVGRNILIIMFRAIFASIFLKEKLDATGKVGCLLSVVGAVIIVLHAPEDKEVTSIDELLFYALQPGKSSKDERVIMF